MAPTNSLSYGRNKFQLPAISSDFGSLTAGTNIPPPPISPVEEKVPDAPQPPLNITKARLPPSPHKITEIAIGGTEPMNFHGVPNDNTHGGQTYHNRNPSNQSTSAASRRTSNGLLHETGPASSAASPSRPNSIRRFLSRNSLSAQYIESDPASSKEYSRPSSPGAGSTYTSPRPPNKKRSSSWFSKFSSSSTVPEEREQYTENKRQSTLFEEKAQFPTKRNSYMGNLSQTRTPAQNDPPPPQLPQLSRFRAKLTEESTIFDAESMFANIK